MHLLSAAHADLASYRLAFEFILRAQFGDKRIVGGDRGVARLLDCVDCNEVRRDV